MELTQETPVCAESGSDGLWEQFEPLLPKAKPGGRPYAHDRRMVFNAVIYMMQLGLLTAQVSALENCVLASVSLASCRNPRQD